MDYLMLHGVILYAYIYIMIMTICKSDSYKKMINNIH